VDIASLEPGIQAFACLSAIRLSAPAIGEDVSKSNIFDFSTTTFVKN